jgi:hypothetical protein
VAREELATYLNSLKDFDPRMLSVPGQTAFWLNVYNACVLRDVPELLGARNVRVTKSFFERQRIAIAAYTWSLDDIEHGLLRSAPKYGRLTEWISKSDSRFAFAPPAFDERVHFAMYTACRSSPPLRVFHDKSLDEELETAARDYIKRTVHVKADGSILQVPKLFQWYAADFGDSAGVLHFVLQRVEDDDASAAIDRRNGKVQLEYSAFDWTLNIAATNAGPLNPT